MPITERVKRLKEKTISKALFKGGYKGNVRTCIERAKYWTEAYLATENYPEIIRRAMALDNVLSKMTLYISPEEIIVGNIAKTNAHLYLSPEVSTQICYEAIEDGYVDSGDIEELRKICEYWNPRCFHKKVEREFTATEINILQEAANLISMTYRDGVEHCVGDMDRLFKLGLDQILADIQAELNGVNQALQSGPDIAPLLEKRHLCEAMLISCNAILKWNMRYSLLASELAEKEKDPTRKKELKAISAIMAGLLRKPTETFQEAVQGFFSVHIILQYIERAGFGALFRPDQTWWPFYKRDVLEQKSLTRTEAQEIIECLWTKMLDLGYFFPRARRLHFQGNSLLQALTIGGQTKEGKDACNDLTVLILEATKSARSNQPTLNFRYHDQVNPAAVRAAIEVVKTGMGMPAFRNDDTEIAVLMDYGAPLEEARNWGVVGCVSGSCISVNSTTKRHPFHLISAKCLELALNDGICMLTGKRLGPKTGDSSHLTSYEAVVEAFRQQVRFAIELGAKARSISRYYETLFLQRPFASALYENTLKKGQDVAAWEDVPNPWVNVTGQVDCADALASIKKLVFQEKQISLVSLVELLKSNWAGAEDVRLMCLHEVPKFGNDDDYVDQIARKDVFDLVVEECARIKDFSGAAYKPLPQSVSIYVSAGMKTAALPNGRKAKEFLSDGGISPNHGCDKKGPTAVLKSVAKIDHTKHKGILLNQRFQPSALAGEKGTQLFMNYLRAWFELGINHIQFNVVDNETLVAAQKNPEKYEDLIVRVAGYSAYFTELNKETQDAIIGRTTHDL